MSDDDDDDESLMVLDPKLINRGFGDHPQQSPNVSEETLVPKFLGNRPFCGFQILGFWEPQKHSLAVIKTSTFKSSPPQIL
eukprot:820791-Amphidinium_carterae.1